MNDRAVVYRERYGFDDAWGTAVTVQVVVLEAQPNLITDAVPVSPSLPLKYRPRSSETWVNPHA